MGNIRSMAELCPLICATVEAGGEFPLITRGTSMRPLLRDGKDTALLTAPPDRLQKGDVPLYRRSDGTFVLHRVVRVRRDGTFDARGDNQVVVEKGIPQSAVIAQMTARVRDGVRTDFGSKADKAYRRKLPFLRLRNRVSILLGRRKRT